MTAQKGLDGEIWQLFRILLADRVSRCDDGILWQGTKILRTRGSSTWKCLMTAALSFSILRVIQIREDYHDLKATLLGEWYEADVATFVSKCLICQQVRLDTIVQVGYCKPLEIPVGMWDEISMILKCSNKKIVRLHGTRQRSYQIGNSTFQSRFWKGLLKAWGTRLKFQYAFHPETTESRCSFLEVSEMIEVPNEKVAVAGKLKEAQDSSKSSPTDITSVRVPAGSVRIFLTRKEPGVILDRAGEESEETRRSLSKYFRALEESSRAGSHLGDRGVYTDFLSSFSSMICNESHNRNLRAFLANNVVSCSTLSDEEYVEGFCG
ncbi:hypothetical protein Tco_0750890 [Tanacetum coccineum]|uniref:Uncharacterized protein n=1 Tax=Tanacetum coccineum TaxID=301880 RepID=A0ABQ4Z2G2_9ASTR